MTRLRRIFWPALLVAAPPLLPLRASAKSGTLTDDRFVSVNSGIHTLRAGLAASEENDLVVYALAGLGSAGVHLGSLEVCSPLVTIYTFIKN